MDAINRVFKLFKDRWPRRFPSIWKTDQAVRDSKRQWLEDFLACRHLNRDTFAAGMERVRLEQWPPDNPGAFLALCHVLPDQLGAPDEDRAFKEACRGAYPLQSWHRWSHKCVYWAAVWTGLSDLAERGEAMRKKFCRQYQQALDCAGDLQDPPTGQLPERRAQVEPDLQGEGYLKFRKALKAIKGTGVTDEN